MIGLELKIIFKQDKAFLTNDNPMDFIQLGLPSVAKYAKSNAYWKIKILNFREEEKKIFCEILSYHIGEDGFSPYQKEISEELKKIEIISFRSIDTAGLLKTLSSASPTSIVPKIQTASYYNQIHNFESQPIVREPIKKTINETFFIFLKKILFKNGCVSFDKKFKEHKNNIELTIKNDEIREEFDAVKKYFANVLKTKKIKVIAKIEIIDNEISSMEVKSPEIEKIDSRLIENVKFEFIKSTTKRKINEENDKGFFTMDEFFDSVSDNKVKSNTFYQDDKELVEDLLKISKTKHYKHLTLLSNRHSHDIMKLRFIYKPFSFIFLLIGDKNYHIIWETLDTAEATYIWHIEKKLPILKMAFRKIENIINEIKVQGKTSYLNSTEDSFKRIYHDYSESTDGFIKWKGELEKILT